MTSALEAEHVSMVFRDGGVSTPVLHDVNARVARGEFVALVGASGSGKSTFLSIAGTLLSPSEGEVRVAGQRTRGLADPELTRLRNRHLGFVFQFHHLLTDFTALENVLMPVHGGTGRIPREAEQRAENLLDRVGLSNRADFRASHLSGGQKQRVAVARALVMRPDLVLADEPTGNLDRASSDEVMTLLRELSREESTGFLLSTHDPRIATLCDRVLVMDDGRLREGRAEDAGPVEGP